MHDRPTSRRAERLRASSLAVAISLFSATAATAGGATAGQPAAYPNDLFYTRCVRGDTRALGCERDSDCDVPGKTGRCDYVTTVPKLRLDITIIADEAPANNDGPQAIPTVTVLFESRVDGVRYFISRSFTYGPSNVFPDIGGWLGIDDEEKVDTLSDATGNWRGAGALACGALRPMGNAVLDIAASAFGSRHDLQGKVPVLIALKQRGLDRNAVDDFAQDLAHVARYMARVAFVEVKRPLSGCAGFPEAVATSDAGMSISPGIDVTGDPAGPTITFTAESSYSLGGFTHTFVSWTVPPGVQATTNGNVLEITLPARNAQVEARYLSGALVSGKTWYTVAFAKGDTANSVCAQLGKTPVEFALSPIVCNSFHPDAPFSSSVPAEGSTGAAHYCTGSEVGACSTRANMCNVCSQCPVGVGFDHDVGNLFGELYIACG